MIRILRLMCFSAIILSLELSIRGLISVKILPNPANIVDPGRPSRQSSQMMSKKCKSDLPDPQRWHCSSWMLSRRYHSTRWLIAWNDRSPFAGQVNSAVAAADAAAAAAAAPVVGVSAAVAAPRCKILSRGSAHLDNFRVPHLKPGDWTPIRAVSSEHLGISRYACIQQTHLK